MPHFRSIVLVIVWVVAVAAPAQAARTDVVHMKNGDRITCSVKQLERGRLKVTTDHMGTIFIDWKHIASVEAAKVYEVELESGVQHYGELQPADSIELLAVETADGRRELPIDEIVTVTEIKRGFFKRLDGWLDLGFNYKKANNDVNYTLGVGAKYRAKKSDTELKYNSILSNRDNAPQSFRNVLEGYYTRYLKKRLFAVGLGRLEQNDELGLDLRTNLGGAVGSYLFQTNRNVLTLSGGAVSNREKFTLDPEERTSLEGLVNVTYDYFIHGDLGADVSTSLSVLPSLTDGDRYRVEFDFKYRQEIITDLNISFSGWYSFDSKAPVTGGTTVRQDDYGLVTSIGWEF